MSFPSSRSDGSHHSSAAEAAPSLPGSSGLLSGPTSSTLRRSTSSTSTKLPRAIQLFDMLDSVSPPVPSSSSSVPLPPRRAINLFDELDLVPPTSVSTSQSSGPVASSSNTRAFHLFDDLGPIPSPHGLETAFGTNTSSFLLTGFEGRLANDPALTPSHSDPCPTVPPQLRRIAKLPARATRPKPIAQTTADAKCSSDIIELTDSDDEISAHRRRPSNPSDLVFNTNDLLSTRQTRRGWRGSYRPQDWVLSRDEFHSEQVDRDQALAAETDTFPTFVSSFFRLHFILLSVFPFQAISAGDLQSVHSYLMARYEADTLDEYVRLLALFRNTRAIELENARNRCAELQNIADTIELAQFAVLRRLDSRRSIIPPSPPPTGGHPPS